MNEGRSRVEACTVETAGRAATEFSICKHMISLSCHWAALRGAWSCFLCSLLSDNYAPVPSLLQSKQPHIKFQRLLWSHCLHDSEIMFTLVLVWAAVGPLPQVSIYLKFIRNTNPFSVQQKPRAFAWIRPLPLLKAFALLPHIWLISGSTETWSNCWFTVSSLYRV